MIKTRLTPDTIHESRASTELLLREENSGLFPPTLARKFAADDVAPDRTSRRNNAIIIINATVEVSAFGSETASLEFTKSNSRVSIF